MESEKPFCFSESFLDRVVLDLGEDIAYDQAVANLVPCDEAGKIRWSCDSDGNCAEEATVGDKWLKSTVFACVNKP